ncbi:hypothetical protein [Streptomyces cavernicola]|uniref:Uncharacterized protein n=1 Tax=Streptomyces cavernicola TaxID=3043613 RepID=A0ABT6SC32_9ACTN|nr:hypothetical protein [Streptomyces sp. B-S-A6]MDI3405748.1 hypothetical protein [Streptomyces sp. B-S-A6]
MNSCRVAGGEFVEAGGDRAELKDRVFVVLRRDVKVDLSSDAYFNSDQIAVRGTMRIGYGHPHPAAITKVALTA